MRSACCCTGNLSSMSSGTSRGSRSASFRLCVRSRFRPSTSRGPRSSSSGRTTRQRAGSTRIIRRLVRPGSWARTITCPEKARPGLLRRGLLNETDAVVDRRRGPPTSGRGAPFAPVERDGRDTELLRMSDQPARDRPTTGQGERRIQSRDAELGAQGARNRGRGIVRARKREAASESGFGFSGRGDRERAGFGLPLGIRGGRSTALHPLRGNRDRQRRPAVDPGERTEERSGRVARREDLRSCAPALGDRKSTRLNSSHTVISYAVFCLKTKNKYT